MPGWLLEDQSTIDACAEALMDAGWYNDVHRGHDDSSPPNPRRSIQIHDPADELKSYEATIGQAVWLSPSGAMLLVMSAEDYAAPPFNGGA